MTVTELKNLLLKHSKYIHFDDCSDFKYVPHPDLSEGIIHGIGIMLADNDKIDIQVAISMNIIVDNNIIDLYKCNLVLEIYRRKDGNQIFEICLDNNNLLYCAFRDCNINWYNSKLIMENKVYDLVPFLGRIFTLDLKI